MKVKPANRRNFIKALGATAFLLQFPFWQACQNTNNLDKTSPSLQQAILSGVLNILFPTFDKTPDIRQINAVYHINRYLTDPLIDPDEQQFIINGTKWLNESAHENFKTDFLQLSAKKQQKLIQIISHESWGESWLSKLLTLTFEALLLDPVYDININECGWKWLQHLPGRPRPDQPNIYPDILDRKKENIIITGLEQL